MSDAIATWLERDTEFAAPRLRLLRVVWGWLFVLTAVALIAWDYPTARSGNYFTLPLVDALGAVPSWLHAAAIYAFAPLSLMFMIGWKPHVGALGMCAVMTYAVLSDWWGFHHGWIYVIHLTGLMAITFWPRPIGLARRYSIAWLRVATVFLYVCAGLNKMTGDFLSGDVIEFLTMANWHGTAVGDFLVDNRWLFAVAGPLVAVSEVCFGLFLLVPRLRIVVYVVGLGMHLAIPILANAGLLFNVWLPAAYLFFCWAPRDNPTIVVSPNRRLVRGLGRLDWVHRFHWRESDGAEPHMVWPDGTTVRGARVGWELVKGIPLLNPLFMVFAGLSLYILADYLALMI